MRPQVTANNHLVDLKEISSEGEDWELFTHDLLRELGFTVESQPDRGPDGGKDLLVTEDLSGALNRYKFRWLVSCKHYVHSGKAVGESDEINIQERMSQFKADGFLGFYSTIASSALNTRLRTLKENGGIRDYRFFDSRLIENHLIRLGFSRLLMRYFPESYRRVKPLHLVTSKYISLACDYCGKDLLETIHDQNYDGLVGVMSRTDDAGKETIFDMYFACKGKCDSTLEERLKHQYDAIATWEDLSDLVIPFTFLNWVLATMNQLRDGQFEYLEAAHQKNKKLILALSQRVLREMTDAERKRAMENYAMLNTFG